ncbi:TPA: hypothetical protein ACGRM4_005213 [Klebsiella oxytoca]|uniref:helix-turn-helix transcriptional regulator n=1 Tax=Klebsiella oxytoca TaxID=571 RepID=UPI00115A2D7C|nr:hypothetical protein [Klebsiella oxytoca]HBV8970903.1 hypothetical protein [Klebsiella oxytoca]
MENRTKPALQGAVEIVTPNTYLARALRVLCDVGLGWLQRAGTENEEAVRVMLVDTACLWGPAEERKRLLSRIREVDAYAFMSYSGAIFDGVPHLRLDRPLPEVRRELVRLVTGLTTGSLPGTPALFSRLNASERQVVLFLMCGYGIREMHESLGLNIKSVYRMRAEVMRKYRLTNRRELYTLLRVYDVLRDLKVAEIRPEPALRDNLAL